VIDLGSETKYNRRNFEGEDFLGQYYLKLFKGREREVHIPYSDVYYAREAVSNALGERYTLGYIEWAMLKEGMISPQHCWNPELQLSWEEYPWEKVC
jgi:hypothetical protein